MKRALIVVGVLAVLVLVTAFALGKGWDDRPVYLTAPVERGKLVTTVTATGTLQAVVTVKVSSQLSGQVTELHADFNDRVTKDQPLARLDQSIFAARVREAKAVLEVAKAQILIRQAAVEKAKADLANARAGRAVVDRRTSGLRARLDETQRDFTRKQRLAKRGAISKRDVERARAAYLAARSALGAEQAQKTAENATILSAQAALRMAQAEVANAQAVVSQRKAALDQTEVELARTVIRSPIDGVVIGRNVDRGQTVAASLAAPTLFEIAQDLKRMELHTQVDEADIGRIRIGPRAIFTVDSFRDRTFQGIVTQVRKAPVKDKNVVTYTVVISADNSDLLLLPGMTAVVRIIVQETGDVLKLPNAALRFRPTDQAPPKGTLVVWVESTNGAVKSVAVRTGTSDGTATELVEGSLKAGDKVIVGHAPAPSKSGLFGLRLGF